MDKQQKLRILFVFSGNVKGGINPFIKSQGEFLKKAGITLEYFPIIGHGMKGYLKAVLRLRKYLKTNEIDLVHAHYSLSGWTALLAGGRTPLIISLMGDDAYGTYNESGRLILKSLPLILSSKLLHLFSAAIITKSENIQKTVWTKGKAIVIPNGVDLDEFSCTIKKDARAKLKLPEEQPIVLFLSNPKESRKNYALAKNAFKKIDKKEKLIAPFPVEHDQVKEYLSAADVLLFTSTAEGSPNLIKEAMSCGCPIVATDVGDVKWIMGNTEGCFITRFDANDVADKMKMALSFGKRTLGRKRIIELGLDAESVAKKIVDVYKKVFNKNTLMQ